MWALFYRDDADGFVARFAGQQAGDASPEREDLEEIRRGCPNGEKMEIREVVTR